MRGISLIGLVLLAFSSRAITAFSVVPAKSAVRYSKACHLGGFLIRQSSRLQSTPDDDESQEQKLAQLGYSGGEIGRSRKENDEEPIKVNVNLLPDVDPITITALGFGLIAFNFFVLGNLVSSPNFNE